MSARNEKITGIIRGISYFIIATVVLATFSCSKKGMPDKSVEAIIYPTPPDTARIQFLTSISTSLNVIGDRSAFGKFLVGEEPPLAISKPYGVTMFEDNIYLCDLDLEGLEIMNLAAGTFEYFVPKGLGSLKLPINCFKDSLGYLYVADTKRKQVVIFSNNNEYVNSIGDGKDKLSDVFVKYGKIWLANVTQGRIDVYKNDSTYQFLYSITGEASAEGKLFQPTNLYVTPNKVYVSDFGEFNIKIYDHKGQFIQKIGSYGKALGQFARPKGIAVDKEGILYVVDAAFENVQMFDQDGNLLMFFGGSYTGPGDMWLPAKVSISYNGLQPFQQYVDKRYTLQYLILVTNNFGPDKLNVYGYIEEKSKINK